MKRNFHKWVPPVLMLVMAAWFFARLSAPKDKDFAFSEFARLPITANGRIEPMDSLARNSLLEIRGKQTLNVEPWKGWDENPKIIPASEWLANVMLNPSAADDWPTFRIDNPDLISQLKLPDKGAANRTDGKHYSWNQLMPMIDKLDGENTRIQANTQPQDRTAYENAVIKLHQSVYVYAQLKNAVQPAEAQDWPAALAAYEKLIPAGADMARAQAAGEKSTNRRSPSLPASSRRFNS